MYFFKTTFLSFLSSPLRPFHTDAEEREGGRERAGMMVRKCEGKRKEAWEAGGQVFHVPASSSLHSPDYIPSPRRDSFSNFSQPREDRLRRSSWLTALTHSGLLNTSGTLIPLC